MSRAWSAVKAFWSRYKPAQPVVVMRVPKWEIHLGRERLADPEAQQQLVAAAAAIRAHYGDEVRFRVYVISSRMADRYRLAAERLTELLQPQAAGPHVIVEMLIGEFFELHELEPGIVPVLVAGKPGVGHEVLNGIGLVYEPAKHGEPHFVLVEQAKLDFERPRYRLSADTR